VIYRAQLYGPGIYSHPQVFELELAGVELQNISSGAELRCQLGLEISAWSNFSLLPTYTRRDGPGGFVRTRRLSWLGWGVVVEVTDAA